MFDGLKKKSYFCIRINMKCVPHAMKGRVGVFMQGYKKFINLSYIKNKWKKEK